MKKLEKKDAWSFLRSCLANRHRTRQITLQPTMAYQSSVSQRLREYGMSSNSSRRASPSSLRSISFCLVLACSTWFPPSLICRLDIFYLVVSLISSLSLVATVCSVWSVCCPSFFAICQTNFHICFSVYSIMSITCVLFLVSEHCTYLVV